MSNTVKLNICPKCSATIPAEAPQGLCPKCVLLGAATATEQGGPTGWMLVFLPALILFSN